VLPAPALRPDRPHPRPPGRAAGLLLAGLSALKKTEHQAGAEDPAKGVPGTFFLSDFSYTRTGPFATDDPLALPDHVSVRTH
jgi:hypothetical protein